MSQAELSEHSGSAIAGAVSRRAFLGQSVAAAAAVAAGPLVRDAAAEPVRDTDRRAPGRIIDAHVHVLDEAGSLGPFPTMGSHTELLQEMDRCSVEKTIMLPVVREGSLDNNERCAQHARQFPDRLATLTDVQLHEPTAAAQVADARDRYGAVGISYYPSSADLSWMTQAACEPLWDAFDTNDLVCNLQITPPNYHVLLTLCGRYPGIRFASNHLGLPGSLADDDDSYGGLLRGVALPNLFIKASGFYACATDPWDLRDARALGFFSKLLRGFGPDRIIWGSDWPPVGWHLTYRQALEILRSAAVDLDDDGRDLVLGGNAARVYKV